MIEIFLSLLIQIAIYPMPKEPADLYPSAKTGGVYMMNYYFPPAGASTPWWPSWSPDGKHLAFSMQGSIWRIRIGETVADEIVYSGEYLSSPEWSPDGRWLAYTSDNHGKSIQLKILDLKSGATWNLTEGEHVNVDPAWSPDGSRLAFVSTRPNGYFNIFVMEIKEGKPREIIQLSRDHRYGKQRLYFGDYDLHIQPTWSRDGKEIIFLSNRDVPLGSGAVWRMPAVANGIDQARRIHKEETLYRTRPHWSPDGRRLIYSSHLGGQFNNLFLLPAEGGEPYKLTFGEWDSFHPRWSPDGEWIAHVSNEEGLPQLWLLKTYGGSRRKVEIKSRRRARPMIPVSVHVLDTKTGQTIPARIYSKASDGKTYAPENAYHRISRLGEHFFHVNGAFTLEVPEGELTVEAMHGFEYYPDVKRVEVRATADGSPAVVTLALKRVTDLKSRGWYSGSNHVHMNYGGNLHNTPANLVFMAEAEDLDVIGELVANKDNRILDHQFFTGGLHPLSGERRLLYFNEEYRPPFYGHISLINLTRNLISPFTTGYEGTAIESLYPSNTDIFRLARLQGALGAYVHPFSGDDDPLEGVLGVAKGFPVDVALGTVDYHELMSRANWAGYTVWHRMLNNGFKIPAVGGEDSISNLHYTAIVGQDRFYAYLGDRLTWQGWIDAIRRGAGFVTNGPLLEFQIQNQISGGEIYLPEEGAKVRVRGKVWSIVPLDQAELVINGKPLSLELPQWSGPGTQFEFERELEITRSSWITFQAYGTSARHPIDDVFPQATTNPIWVYVGDQPIRSEESARYFIRWIDKLTAMAEADPGWRSQKEKDHVLAQFRQARAVYARLEEEAKELKEPGASPRQSRAPTTGDRMQTGFLNRTMTVGGVFHRYQVYVPSEWDPGRKWPVVLFLHGAGERGNDGLLQTQVGIAAAIRRFRERFPFIVVMPQCLDDRWWSEPEMEQIALRALDASVKEFNGDPARLYLTGLSMGGYGAWSIASKHPNKFAALAPICGGIRRPAEIRESREKGAQDSMEPYIETAQKIGATPVWVFHGDADTAVPVSESRKMVEALTETGGNVKYTEYPGVGHNSWDRAYSEPDFVRWLLSHLLSKK